MSKFVQTPARTHARKINTFLLVSTCLSWHSYTLHTTTTIFVVCSLLIRAVCDREVRTLSRSGTSAAAAAAARLRPRSCRAPSCRWSGRARSRTAHAPSGRSSTPGWSWWTPLRADLCAGFSSRVRRRLFVRAPSERVIQTAGRNKTATNTIRKRIGISLLVNVSVT